ncbi:GlsB/YeaQ/YmgE family stress response membrane protein [Microbacterium sp. GXF7504]
MEILLALVFGAVVGSIAQAVLPGRDRRGMLLLPMLGTVVGGAVWMLLTWVGLTGADPWIWLASILAPVVVVVVAGVVLARTRETHDARERERLKLG